MSDLDYFKGQWEQFREWEGKEHEHIRRDLTDIKEKVDSLRLWRASVIGMASVLGAFFGWLASHIRG